MEWKKQINFQETISQNVCEQNVWSKNVVLDNHEKLCFWDILHIFLGVYWIRKWNDSDHCFADKIFVHSSELLGVQAQVYVSIKPNSACINVTVWLSHSCDLYLLSVTWISNIIRTRLSNCIIGPRWHSLIKITNLEQPACCDEDKMYLSKFSSELVVIESPSCVLFWWFYFP